MTRTAAGRRALHVALLVGGLFVLGLVCGEQARAADGVAQGSTTVGLLRSVVLDSKPSTVTSPTAMALSGKLPADRPSNAELLDAKPAHGQLPDAGLPNTDEVQRVVRPVTERVVRPAAEHVVRPVEDLVDRMTGGIAEQPAPPQWWPPVPPPPTLPGTPGVPGTPGLPESPGLPGVPAVPGQSSPAGSAPRQPGRAAEKHESAETKARGETGWAYGPRLLGGSAAAVTVTEVRQDADAHDAHDAQVPQTPAHRLPDGDPTPTDALGRHCAADKGSSRHGDAQVTGSHEGVRPILAPGPTTDVTASGTRDRFRDVPASPG
ncbi:hypothetical protein O1Q96_40120 [Streptomyces sp. Qhu-G9]|uniref:hypothetical protein n=1 Tax=Streptomyces sp. Qhu-G9 TaxID=3452799 RepID=UPI0022ABF96C|nr:hypothetical protein [Streptomyces aurantiacus]WAU85368.1 hypothetical protein O1Q96_40120 [Streptomyces aurantiacus]